MVPFEPAEYADKARIRRKLGYGPEPLVICATGGSSAGKEMLETCGKAGVELHGFLPDLYEHYAACDMAVVVGSGTTTVELTALRRPFIFFPLENQFDQQLYIAERLARQGAGIKMRYYETTPELLAAAIRAHIGKEVSWKPIPTAGAQEAARQINAA